MTSKIAVIDIETTDLKPEHGFIVEIGIVALTLGDGSCTPLFSSLIKEDGFDEHSRGAWIFRHSDIKFDDVLRAPSFNELKNEIQAILDQYFVTAYNKLFDFGFLRSRGLRITKELPDIMKAAQNACKILLRRGKYKLPNVQEAWNILHPNNKYIEAHRAIDDAVHEAQILYEMYRQNKYKISFK